MYHWWQPRLMPILQEPNDQKMIIFLVLRGYYSFTYFCFFNISISPESCGKEEKFGKLTENISTITVTTFAMVFLWTTSSADMLEKLSANQKSSTNDIAITIRTLDPWKNVSLPWIRSWITFVLCSVHPSPSSIKMLNAERLLLRINIIANWPLNFYICFTFQWKFHLLHGR